MIRIFTKASAVMLAGLVVVSSANAQRDWYVSVETGKGKKGTMEKPAKDVGNIVNKLQPGDTINIAAGTYVGRGGVGHDKITVPVRIIGGWNQTFTERDPWGKHLTIFGGDNLSKNFSSRPRLEIVTNRCKNAGDHPIVVDGIIVDNGLRNSYTGEGNAKINRKYTPATGANATPDSPGIALWSHTGCKMTVQNCIVINTAPSGRRGAIEVKGNKDCESTIRNNVVMNNTSGIACLSVWHGKGPDGRPKFTVENNTVLFTWKFDPIATHGGTALQSEPCHTTATGNVFAFGDYYGVYNRNGKDTENMILNKNLFCANMVSHYMEWDTQIAIADIEDEAEKLEEAAGNVVQTIKVPVSPEWAKHYAARTVIDRQKAEGDVKAVDNGANEWRRMLGLPLQGTDLKADSDVWLHRLPLEDALTVARATVAESFGHKTPVTVAAAGQPPR